MAILRKIKDYINNYISVGMARQRRKFESTHPSPDGKHIIGFAFISEVQMSVWYFGCYIDGRIIKDREFGDICVWSHDGRYFAVQEWLSTNRSRGPDTQILVVDADVRSGCTVGRTVGGFVIPLSVSANSLRYRASIGGQSVEDQLVDLPDPEDWIDLRPR